MISYMAMQYLNFISVALLLTTFSCGREEKRTPPASDSKSVKSHDKNSKSNTSKALKPSVGPSTVELQHSLLELLHTSVSEKDRGKFIKVFSDLAQTNFESGLAFLEEIAPGVNRSSVIGVLLDNAKNPKEKAAIIGNLVSLGYPEDWEMLTGALQRFDSSFNSEQIALWLGKSNHKETREALLASLARTTLRSEDLAVALANYQTLKLDAASKETYDKYLYLVYATRYNKSAIRYVETASPQTLDRKFLINVVNQYAREDASAAKNWVLKTAERVQMPELAGTMARYLLQIDSMAGSKWVQTIPQGPLKDQAISEVVGMLSSAQDYDAANIWIKAVSNEQLRGEMTAQYLRSK